MRKKRLDFRIDENGCFVITSHRINGEGYGFLYYEGREQGAHRVVYKECFGEIPEGLVVRHKCDNRSCINPEHLELGTHTENMQDAVCRERNAYGERNGRAKINEETARRIKIMLRDGIKSREIRDSLGVSVKIVRAIRENRTWKHVDISA
ncbi:HNH endonuclease signature motif containing protein [Paenibacillus ottowii]|uniref:HNH endonuclease n=1 Tax=Paenibacillus ottowii TaxID=2315729 RepID=A0ABY3B551_9BACL|nr:HNH endonuclease signature motif containing protein [Paenibacillus ottowii]TQR97324.1 HNH endonuclease [Paenibacillus ottowii]